MKPDVGFDPVGGSLRLSRETLARMRDVHAGHEISEEAGAALRAAALLQGTVLHPRLVAVVETAARPLARLSLDVSRKTPLHCDGWVGQRFALLLTAASATHEVFDATFLSRSLLTAQVARFVDVGPRPRPKVADPIEIDQGLLEAVLGGGQPLTASQLEMLLDARDEVLPVWLEVLSTLSARPHKRWRAGVWWNSFQETPQARSLEILDSDAGLFFIGHAARADRRYRRVRLRPVTPSQVWRLLCALIPPPNDVAEPLSY